MSRTIQAVVVTISLILVALCNSGCITIVVPAPRQIEREEHVAVKDITFTVTSGDTLPMAAEKNKVTISLLVKDLVLPRYHTGEPQEFEMAGRLYKFDEWVSSSVILGYMDRDGYRPATVEEMCGAAAQCGNTQTIALASNVYTTKNHAIAPYLDPDTRQIEIVPQSYDKRWINWQFLGVKRK